MNKYSEIILRSYEDGTPIENEKFRDITFSQAVRTQQEVLEARGWVPSGFKVLVRSNDGLWAVAPMVAEACIQSDQILKRVGAGLLGFEVELAVVLKHDITLEMARLGIEGVLPAIDHAMFGLEILQTRFDDHAAAGPNAQLADNLNNGGYVFGAEAWTGGLNVDGLELQVLVNEESVFEGHAKYAFSHPLHPIVQFALLGSDPLGVLKAGSVITTGALCGVLPLSDRSRISVTVAGTYRLGAEVVAD